MADALRIARLRRALGLSDKLWRLEQSRLQQMDIVVAQLRGAEESVLNALTDAAYDPRLAATRLASLAQARGAALEARNAQLLRTQAAGRRARMLQRLVERSEVRWRREQAIAALRRLSSASMASSA